MRGRWEPLRSLLTHRPFPPPIPTQVLRSSFSDLRAEYYPGGMVHSDAKPTFFPLDAALARLGGPAGQAGQAYFQLNLAPDRWDRMLELSGAEWMQT